MYYILLAHRYHSRAEFLADIELIATNCEQYNGSESRFTKNAKHILEYARSQLEEVINTTEIMQKKKTNFNLILINFIFNFTVR